MRRPKKQLNCLSGKVLTDHLVGGSASETPLRRNRLAFDKVAFRPRILVNVEEIDTSTTFLGQKLHIPAILAPIGSLQVFAPDAGVASTQAATEFGIMHALSSVTEPTLEETAAATPTPKIFQLYVHGDMKWVEDIISRLKEAGYAALALRRCLKSLMLGNPSYHQVSHDDVNHRLAALREELIILVQSPVFVQPTECPLHPPPFGQNHQPFHVVGGLDNLETNLARASKLPHPSDEWPRLGAIGPNTAQAGQLMTQKSQ